MTNPASEQEKAIKMHCRQCEYAPPGGCTQVGVCGKDPVIIGGN